MIARLLMSDIVDCIAANPRYFLLWTLSQEAFKLVQRFIFFFIFIFLIKRFLIEKQYLEKTPLEVILWLAPYLFLFALGTLAVALMKKYSRRAQKRFNISFGAPTFQQYHMVPRSKIVNGLRSCLTFLLYLIANFFVCWIMFGTILSAIFILGATFIICIVLFAGTKRLMAHTTALIRQPAWNLIEAMILVIYYSFMMCIVIFMKIEANFSAMIFIILIPRQLISSLVGCAQSYAFCHTKQVATLAS